MKKLFILTVLLWSCGSGSESPTAPAATVRTPPSGGGAVAPLQDRVALVIGNGAYQWVKPRLNSPAKDAEDMAAMLKNIGFGHVTTLLNGSRKAMLDALTTLATQAKGKSVVVYYSGHGVQLSEENYLVPVDAPDPQTPVQAKTSCVAVNDVLDELHAAGCRPKILILDACRNNPFKGLGGGKAVGGKGGLAKPESKFSETYLAFATNPGEVAPDGASSNENSPYTQVLLEELRKPNVQIEQTFKKVRARLEASGQTPWENTSLKDDFVFFPKEGLPTTISQHQLPIEPEMVLVQGGTFQMGHTYTKEDENRDEKSNDGPKHKVTVSSFSIGKYEITVGQYLIFCGATSYPCFSEIDNKSGYPDMNLPIVDVSWNDAMAYCKWLSARTGNTYRLPTEAEWEYAARGGQNYTNDVLETTNLETTNQVWVWLSPANNFDFAPVGKYKPNGYGLYDMDGNVSEWCYDWYGDYTSKASSDPIGPAEGESHVVRDGAHRHSTCRVSSRTSVSPSEKWNYLGFRVVLTARGKQLHATSAKK